MRRNYNISEITKRFTNAGIMFIDNDNESKDQPEQ